MLSASRKETRDPERKRDMSRQYQYVRINDYFFCLQQNPAILAWILFLKSNDLLSIYKPWLKKRLPRHIMSYLRHYYRLFISNFQIFIIFLQYQLNLRNHAPVVELPVYGQLCKQVHMGYKIFDLRSGVVVKIFDPVVSKSRIVKEIERLKKVSQIVFAPSIRRWNIAERWYEEDYINGSLDSSKSDSATLLNSFFHDVVPCLNSLILLRHPLNKKLNEYINEMIEILEVNRSSKQKLDAEEDERIRNFIYSTVEQLSVEGNCDVYLVFTHGDFCPSNMLYTKNGIKVVDWESAAYRSLFFDFYSYFFFRPVCRGFFVEELVSEISAALPIFISSLASKVPDITENLSAFEKVYRRLYYIELLCELVERRKTDNQLNILDFILRYIDAFNRYEELFSDNVMK